MHRSEVHAANFGTQAKPNFDKLASLGDYAPHALIAGIRNWRQGDRYWPEVAARQELAKLSGIDPKRTLRKEHIAARK